MKLATAAILLLSTTSAYGGLITTAAGGILEDFNSRPTDSSGATMGPVTLPTGVVFTSLTFSVLGSTDYYLFDNGFWQTSKTPFAGSASQSLPMTFTLPHLASAVSGFVNYARSGGQPQPPSSRRARERRAALPPPE